MYPDVAFLDTNVFLHYKPIDEIDWPDLLKVDRATLIVAPVVLRELDKLKSLGEKARTRARAASAIRKLSGYLSTPSSAVVGDRIEIHFVESDPVVAFEPLRLSPELPDDWLIATMLEHRANHPGSCITLVTGDLGLQVKARTHSLSWLELPHTLKLPEETDADQRRIRELEREVLELKRRLPDLRLTFENGANHRDFSLSKGPPLTVDAISQLMAELRLKYPKAQKPDHVLVADLVFGVPSDLDIKKFNTMLDKFYVAYEAYLRAAHEDADMRGRVIRVALKLKNIGSCPADDIGIHMSLPDGLRVAETLEELCKPPKEPMAPSRPRTQLEKNLLQSVSITPAFDILNRVQELIRPTAVPAKLLSNVSGPKIRRTDSFEVDFHVGKLKHNLQVDLDPLVIAFDSWDTSRSFTFGYRLLAGNVPDPVEGKLHVVVEVKDAG